MSELKPIRPAATVVVCRDAARGLELLLLKRSSRSSFMASVMVYPGGALDEEDAAVARSPRVRAGRELWSRDTMAAHAIAALRENFEETGLLCAQLSAQKARTELRPLRTALLDGGISFSEVLDRLDAHVDLDDVWYFSRWVTPNWETKRYDARFFLARAPESQEASFDRRETDAGGWYTPEEAIAAYEEGELVLSPPTWATLTDLRSCPSVEAAQAYARGALPSPILPHFTDVEEGQKAVLLPGDTLYPLDLDWQVDTTPRVVPTRTRIAFVNSRWAEVAPTLGAGASARAHGV